MDNGSGAAHRRTHLDLFSGIGGFALAASWAGYETVLFCEIDRFCQAVLRKNFPGVPIHDDVRTLAAEHVPGPVDLLTGGFPCQPVSVAGQRRGDADDRWLWPEMARVVGEVRPRYVLAENVPGLIGMALDGCLADLEGLGYACRAVIVPACAVGAWHRRDRVWIVAHAAGVRRDGHPTFAGGAGEGEGSWRMRQLAGGGQDAADAARELPRGGRNAGPGGRAEPAIVRRAPADADR